MANRVLHLQRQRTTLRNRGLRHQRLVDQHILDRAYSRIGVELRVLRLLLRQLARMLQIVHDLVDVCRNGLRDLESEPNLHAEQIIRTEILHRILAGERLIGRLHGHSPPCACTLGMVRENREEDVGVKPLHFAVGCQIHDIVCEIRDTEVPVQLFECRQEILALHMATLRTFDLRAVVPRDHDHQNHQGQQHREPAAVHELRHRGDEEHDLDGQEHDREHDCPDFMSVVPHVHGEQHSRGDHRDGQCEAVGGGDMLRIAEQEQHGERGDAQHAVDHRDIQLAACTGRVTHLQMRHPVEAGGFGDHGERAGDQRLRGDDACGDRQRDRKIAHARAHHLEERIEAVHILQSGIVLVTQHPRTLPEVVEHKRDLDEWPGEVDVAATHVAHIRIQRLGTRGRQEDRAHQGDAGGVMRAEQETEAVHRVEGSEDAPIIAQVEHAHDGEEAEPHHHDAAEYAADAFCAT